MNLYELFILGVNIKYIVLYRHINVPMACKEVTISRYKSLKCETVGPSLSRIESLYTCFKKWHKGYICYNSGANFQPWK